MLVHTLTLSWAPCGDVQKAAKQRKCQASALTAAAMAKQQVHNEFARALLSGASPAECASEIWSRWSSLVNRNHAMTTKQWRKSAKACVRSLQLLQQDLSTREIGPTLARVHAGLLQVMMPCMSVIHHHRKLEISLYTVPCVPCAQARPLHHALGAFYDQHGEIEELELRFERVHAEVERQPPRPSGLELVCAGNNTIEVRTC